MPKGLAHIHEQLRTPVYSILATGMIMVVVIVALDVEKIAKLASAFKIMLFIAVNVSVVVLRESRVQWYKPTYRSPLYPFTQILGIGGGLALLVYMGTMVPVALGIIAVPSVALYFLYGRSRARRRGVFRMMMRSS